MGLFPAEVEQLRFPAGRGCRASFRRCGGLLEAGLQGPHGSWQSVAGPTPRAQSQALDRPLLRGPAGAAEAGAAGADAGARRVLQLRGARGARPRGAGECGASRLPPAPRSPAQLGRAEERGPGGGLEAGNG